MTTDSKVTLEKVYNLIQDMRDEMKEDYVSKSEFGPVKSIVYGMVGLIMAGVMTAMVAQVVRAFI